MAGPAAAHPHVWVAVKSDVVFAPDGRVTAIRHSWTFDDMYSAFATQGLAKNGKIAEADLMALAKINVEQLEEAGFFTFVRAGGRRVEFAPAVDYKLTMDDRQLLTLHFTAPLRQPASAGRAFVMQVYDPTYFVAFDLEKTRPVSLASAPSGCSYSIAQPPPLAPEYASKLKDVQGTDAPPGPNFGLKLAARVVVACP